MAICPRCGASFEFSEPHVCPGRDYRKAWAILAAIVGAGVGYRVGVMIGLRGAAIACGQPNAGNLCGLLPWAFTPVYEVICAGAGALAGVVIALAAFARAAGNRRERGEG